MENFKYNQNIHNRQVCSFATLCMREMKAYFLLVSDHCTGWVEGHVAHTFAFIYLASPGQEGNV